MIDKQPKRLNVEIPYEIGRRLDKILVHGQKSHIVRALLVTFCDLVENRGTECVYFTVRGEVKLVTNPQGE